jgi:hypothetical protein
MAPFKRTIDQPAADEAGAAGDRQPHSGDQGRLASSAF